MDIFALRNHIIAEYTDYTRSFLTIRDPDIATFVDHELARGQLWPDALLQLSPAYLTSTTVAHLVQHGTLHPHTAAIFQVPAPDGSRHPIRLYHHQSQAIQLAANRQHFVVTTGTGSGKSLTYLLPIVDDILRHDPHTSTVRAIIVYPMNALINSQLNALERFVHHVPPNKRVLRFARYTGQETAAEKAALQHHPPHILLTNYVMLELMLTRPEEHRFVDRDQMSLRFIVLDELHTYRGRQGADVAVLMRRLRERSGHPDVLCIGTSATMVSDPTATDEQRRTAVASTTSAMFGVPFAPQHVIEETLTWSLPATPTPTTDQLRQAIQQPLPSRLDWDTFQRHPLAAWIEATYGVRTDPNDPHRILRRVAPQTLRQGATHLAESTGLPCEQCEQAIQHFLQASSTVRDATGKPGFAFKLHQFLSQGSAVFATLEYPPHRTLTLEGQRYLAAPTGEADRLLFPLVFCRTCGTAYALCAYDQDAQRLEPRHPMSRGDDSTPSAQAGYLLVGEDVWDEEANNELLPDSWFRVTRTGRTLKREYQQAVPRRLYITPDGRVFLPDRGAAIPPSAVVGWFLSAPFLTCLHCGVVYTRRDRDDFRKLARLSSEGRSTATTLVSVSTIDHLRHSSDDPTTHKLLSFTDNRQDASLQAGHFNDFATVVALRSALYQAVVQRPASSPLTYQDIAQQVCRALNLPQEAYAKDVGASPRAQRRNEAALTRVLDYRLYEDMRRSWRITQPNLEQCGLLSIAYRDLEELCADLDAWLAHPLLRDTPPDQRQRTIRTFLDHLRHDLCIDAPILTTDEQTRLVQTAEAALHPDTPWTLNTQERTALRRATRFVLPGDEPLTSFDRSLAPRSALGRFLRSPDAWPLLDTPLDEASYEQVLTTLLDVLIGEHLLTDVTTPPERRAVQLRHDALLWCVGTGTPPPPDPLRTRWMVGMTPVQAQANTYFQRLYRQPMHHLRTMEGREHTGQTDQHDRAQREEQFRAGTLSVLFCSPTMELGIDIADLNVVHMRNVPPTPANYAQRSGRAGRSGQPALVVTYASSGSGHDQYFFQRPLQMVAGAVAPPQLDLTNEDLLRAHVHAVWLRATGVQMNRSMLTVIDTSQPDLPLHASLQTTLRLSPDARAACLRTCQRLLDESIPANRPPAWLTPDWLAHQLDTAPDAFNRACDRWRELYQAADEQLREARLTIDRSHQQPAARTAVRDAQRRQDEATRQKDQLCNVDGGSQNDGDFSPYRYFASEGFLPGYNFPRLPVRAFLARGNGDGVFLSRPRFLALREFGPQNIIYHEGHKYRVTRTMVPAGTMQRRLLSAKVCRTCGAFFETLQTEVCDQCGTRLSDGGAETLVNLFEMTTVLAHPTNRITCEEEERQREGYRITTHVQFSRDQAGQRSVAADAVVAHEQEANQTLVSPLLHLTYGPAATLWRINRGWQRSRHEGFTLDIQRGEWGRTTNEPDDDPTQQSNVVNGVRIVVRDTRNVLLVHQTMSHPSLETVVSLQYALQRGIEQVFQLEEQELGSERLGNSSQGRILFWETSEGGAGVLRRLVEEPDALARVAQAALDICHFSPPGDHDDLADACRRACYRCLLSYTNQPDHALLNRHAIASILRDLAQSVVQMTDQPAPVPAATDLLAQMPDGWARQVLEHICDTGRRLPDAVQTTCAGHLVHLFYAPSYCVVCPDATDDHATIVADLEDQGYIVVVVQTGRDTEEQMAPYTFWCN